MNGDTIMFKGPFIRISSSAFTIVLLASVLILPAAADSSVPQFVDVEPVDICTLALAENGTVWAWGSKHGGLCGVEDSPDMPGIIWSPVMLSNLTNITAIEAYPDIGMALRDDGTVWMWGGGAWGVFGNGGGNSGLIRLVPEMVPGLSNVTQISCDLSFAMALHDDGTVWTWGDNEYGELGGGHSLRARYWSSPGMVEGLSDVKAIACGRDNPIAVKSDGTVWTWGRAEAVWCD